MKEFRLIKSFSIFCASAVLIYLAVANALYGQSSTERGDVKCTDQLKVKVGLTSSAASNVQPADAARISPADVYALFCERAEENKAWSEPTPLPGNVNRRIERPFNVTVK